MCRDETIADCCRRLRTRLMVFSRARRTGVHHLRVGVMRAQPVPWVAKLSVVLGCLHLLAQLLEELWGYASDQRPNMSEKADRRYS